MSTQSSHYTIRLTPIFWLILMLLVSGNILFYIGWFQPHVAACAITLSLGAIVYLMRRISPHLAEHQLTLSRLDLIKFCFAALAILGFLVASGFIGYFGTDWDHRMLRQSLYINLIEAPWPVVLPNGRELTYYIANMLPPALVARCFDEGLRQYVLLSYVFIFYMLIYTLACFYLKKISLLALLLLLFFSDPAVQIFMRIQAYIIYEYFPALTSFGEMFIRSVSFIELTPLGKSVGPYNSSLPVLLVTGMFFFIKTSRHIAIPILVVLLLPASPLGALALMPIALYFYLPIFKDRKKIFYYALSLIVPILLALPSVAYYLRASNPITYIRFPWDVMVLESFLALLFRQLIATLIFVVPLLFCRSIGNIKYLLLMPLLTSLVYYGFVIEEGRVYVLNEFYLKGVLNYTFILVLLWVKAWGHFKYYRYILLIIASLTCLFWVKNSYKSFAPDYEVVDFWNGHMNHDNSFWDRAIPPLKEDSFLKDTVLKESGASEETFLGSLLPKAPGCDYSKPPNPPK